MRFVYLGDIVGRSGRDAVMQAVPVLKKELNLDIVVVNGENSAGGFGITKKIAEGLFLAGVDIITTGNHVWDQKEVLTYIETEPRLIRPLNYPKGTPGKGVAVATTRHNDKLVVIQVMGQVFMDALNNPFTAIKEQLDIYRLGINVDAILIDIHGEAGSEKMAMGHFCDGLATAVCGTHTHIPTADAMIFPKGTAYQTDLGMCGDYNSVIGMDTQEPISRFCNKRRLSSFEPASGEATVCGIFVETDKKTGLALQIKPIRMGGRLENTLLKV